MSRIRLLFAAIILLLLIGASTALIFSILSFLPNAWSGPLGGIVTSLGAIFGAVVSFFGLMPSGVKVPDPATAAKRLFSALKQRRDEDGHAFNLNRLHAEIPLTLRDYTDPPDAAGQSIFDVYSAHPNLLILGGTGSGKTALLQRLTLELMDKEIKARENTEEARWLPVFLPLHDWAKQKKPFKKWLTKQLRNKISVYGLDKPLIHDWLSSGNLILLLDGLDEMPLEASQRCIDAINNLRRETLSPFVISCEQNRYETLKGGQHLLNIGQRTVVIQDLTPAQEQEYLDQVGARKLSRHYRAVTPRILQMWADADLRGELPEENISETALMKLYVNHAIRNRGNLGGVKDMRYWLTQLANCMDDSPFFYFHPDHLPTKMAKILYTSSTWLIIVLLGGAACLLADFGKFPPWQLLPLLALIAGLYGVLQLIPLFALIPGLYGFLLKAIVTGLCMVVLYLLTFAFPFFPLASSKGKTWLRKLGEVLFTEIALLSPTLLLIAVKLIWLQAIGIPIWLGILGVWWVEGLLCYVLYRLKLLQRILKSGNRASVLHTWFTVVYLMIIRLIEPLSPDKLSPKTATPSGLKTGMLTGISSGMIIWFAGFLIWHANLFLAALLLGISIWLDRGLGASLRGYLLRFWFWRYKILPWRAAGFLDNAVTMRLLVVQGNGYGFFYGASMKHYFQELARDEQI